MKRKLLAIPMVLMLFVIVLPVMVEKSSASGALGGIWHLDEGTGTVAYDSSGNGNHGTVYGGAIWTNGKIGKALEFDGVNDYVNVPDSNSLDITGKITLEAWIYPYTVTTTQVIVQKYNYSGPPYNGAYYLGVGGYGYNNKILFGLSHNGYNFYYILSNTNISPNTWTHVAATSNGTHMSIYINGVKDKVASYPPGVIYASAAPLRIGCFLPELGVSRFFNGIIDEVRVAAGTIWTVDDDRVQCPNADFTSIQAAINAASPDDTIIVHDGNYNEALYINKRLTIKAASTPVVKGCQMRATNYGNRQATIFVEDADNVILEGLDVEGQGLGVPEGTKSYAIIYENSHGAIRDCIVSPNTIDDMYSAAIAAWDNSDVTIKNCLVKNFGRIGIYSNNATLTIQSNTIIGQVYNLDNKVNYGIEIEDYSGASIAEITSNEIYNCDNTHPNPLWSSCAIIIDIWRGFYDLPSSTVSIENNNIHHNFEAIEIVSNSLSYAHYNDIYDNIYGVWVDSDLYNNYATFDARFNWWGDVSGPNQATTNPSGLGNDAGDYVDYSPWLGAAYEITPRTYHVNPTGTIQEAIDEASSGDTVMVHGGTYNEALYVNKNISIFGASLPIIRGSGSFTTNYGAREAVIFVENAVVTLWHLDIEGQGLGPSKNYGVIYEESIGTIRSCIISPNTIGDMVGNAIGIWDGSDVDIRECAVKNFGRIGVFFYNGCSGGVYNCTIEGQVYSDQDYVNYGIEIEPWNDPCDVEILGNGIYDCDNTHPSPSWSSAGIVIDGWVAFYDLPSSTVVMSYNDIYNNYYGIEVVANPNSYAQYNNIYDNREYGVIEDSNSFGNNVNFDARYCWWGNASGPYHPTLNPEGLGDNVSDYVDFIPWLPEVHDVAVIDVSVSPTTVVAGETVAIGVTVENQGSDYESFTVTVYYDGTSIDSQDVIDLLPNWNTTLTFYWDTTGMARGIYAIKAEASTVSGEADTLDNRLTDGSVEVLWHDVAVVDVVANRTWVYQRHSASINVTVMNQGDFPETVTITLYYNITTSKIIGTETVDLQPDESTTTTFIWDTTGVEYCHNYTITAVATITPSDNDPGDNTLEDGKIKVRILGDIDGNGIVNMADIYKLILNFLVSEDEPTWNPDLNLVQDRIINMQDIYWAIKNFMYTCP